MVEPPSSAVLAGIPPAVLVQIPETPDMKTVGEQTRGSEIGALRKPTSGQEVQTNPPADHNLGASHGLKRCKSFGGG